MRVFLEFVLDFASRFFSYFFLAVGNSFARSLIYISDAFFL